MAVLLKQHLWARQGSRYARLRIIVADQVVHSTDEKCLLLHDISDIGQYYKVLVVPERFVFRQVDSRDVDVFLKDGEIRAKNHPKEQACHQTSYQTLVHRRGTEDFHLPFGGVVNDCVAFYFSPLTAFTFAIHRGSVQVISPVGEAVGMSCKENRVFFVAKAVRLFEAGLECCFSNYALNSKAPEPVIVDNFSLLETHIDWSMFDEYPMVGAIPEIGYGGVCQYFHSTVTPEKYQLRKQIRMAELLARKSVSLNLFSAIVTPTDGLREVVQQKVTSSGYNIPVYFKPGCFIS